MGRLDGKVVIVTGAARGIGAATAKRLAEEGARVTVADLDAEGAEKTAAEISTGGKEAAGVPVDVADPSQVQNMVDRTLARFGRLDILVNNAGILRDNLLFKMSDDDWDRVLAVHLRGAFLCARAAQKPMVEQKSGR